MARVLLESLIVRQVLIMYADTFASSHKCVGPLTPVIICEGKQTGCPGNPKDAEENKTENHT